MTTNTYMTAREGDTVTANYMGNIVTGVVTLARSHSIRWDVQMLHIKFAEPTRLTICGGLDREPRTGMVLTCGWDGQQVEGFSGSELLNIVKAV
jgi:hypothetical protein